MANIRGAFRFMPNGTVTLKEDDFNGDFERFKAENEKLSKKEKYFSWLGYLKTHGVDRKIINALKKAYSVTAKVVTKTGTIVMRVGSMLLSALKKLCDTVPYAISSLTVGIFIKLLVGSIPLFGVMFSWLATLVAAVIGITGLCTDLISVIMKSVKKTDENNLKSVLKDLGVNV